MPPTALFPVAAELVNDVVDGVTEVAGVDEAIATQARGGKEGKADQSVPAGRQVRLITFVRSGIRDPSRLPRLAPGATRVPYGAGSQ